MKGRGLLVSVQAIFIRMGFVLIVVLLFIVFGRFRTCDNVFPDARVIDSTRA